MKIKMKNKKRIGIITSVLCSVIVLLAVVIGVSLSKKSNEINVEQYEDKVIFDDAHYSELMQNEIEESNLKFEIDSETKTATLVGFSNVTASNLSNYNKFLNIPEVLQDGSTVTKINLTNMDQNSITVRSLVRGIKIPKTVTYIESYSFYGFGSLEYFETPFIGTERGSSGIGRLYPDDLTKVSKPFVSMFSTPCTDKTDDAYDDQFFGYVLDANGNIDNTKATSSVQSAWYEKNEGDVEYYYVPGNLQKIVVYDDTVIGNHALFNLNMVTTIEITKDEEELAKSGLTFGDYAIAESSSLVNVTLPSEYVSLSLGLFNHDTSLKTVKLPGKVTSIPSAIFDNCLKLEEVYMPASVVEIGAAAFKDCQALSSITRFDTSWDSPISKFYDIDLPTGLKTIGDDAFKNCYEFKKISLSNSVEYIGEGAFNGCVSLEELRIPFVGAHRGTGHIEGVCNEGSNSYKFHNLFGFIFGTSGDAELTYTANQKFNDGTESQNFAIPKTLKTVFINDETQIQDGALQNLTSLELLTLNSGITSISEGALNGCVNLKELSLPFAGSAANSGGHIGYIFGKTAYNGGVSSNSYYIPKALTTVIVTNQPILYTNTFSNCTYIENVVIGNETTEIREQVFYNNPVLKKISVPFVGLHRGIFNPSYWWWRDEAWRNTLQWMFSSSYHNSTYANNSLRYYDSYIKYIPSSLEEVTITDDTVISTYAFKNFSSLKVLNITSDNLTYMDQACMAGCYNLEILNVPFIGQNINASGYSGKEYTIGWFFGQNAYANSYSASQYATFYIPKSLQAITISGDIVKIPDYAMAGMKTLKSFTTNGTIDILGSSAFYNCIILEKVLMPNARYTNVGNYAFYNCQNLYDIDAIIPETVTKIGNYAFSGSSVGGDIHPLDLSKYTDIGNYAFSNCHQIKKIKLSSNNKTLGEGAFQDCQYLTDVTLAGKVSKNLFKNCYMLEDIDFTGIKNIPEGVLSGCKSLKVADGLGNGFIQDELTEEIGAYAFFGCESLDSFSIRYTTKKIGSYAFSECTGLEYMIIPKETEIIEPNGWDNCDPNFFFYVYEQESDWPEGWVENWNCYYPVYVLGQQNDSIFTYEYYPTHKGYFITGVEQGVTLEGQIQLPSYHDGLRVLGVYGITDSEGVVKNNISQQTNITSIIIPDSYYFIYEGVFKTGNRVDLYFEHTKSQVAAIQGNADIPDTDDTLRDRYTKGWTVEQDENKWISGGLVFYGNDWEYVNVTANSKVPYIKASSIEFDLNFGGINPIYNGKAITANSINKIILPAYVVVSAAVGTHQESNIISTFADQDFTDIFSYTYENNVSAGNASIIGTLKYSRYQEYLKALKDAGENQIFITGTKKQNFEIKKSQIDLYYNLGANYDTHPNDSNYWDATILTHEYNQYQWKNSNWNSYVSGLESFSNAKFTGTLATARSTVGVYYFNSNEEGRTYYNNGNFVWTTPWAVTRNGVDITKNFEIYLYLVVEINPMKVTLEWTGGSWNDSATQDFYQYRYNGSEKIEPQAIAYRYDSVNNTPTTKVVDYCTVIAKNKLGNVSGFPSDTLYEAYAYLKDNYNFMLVDKNGNQLVDNVVVNDTFYSGYEMQYKIIQGLIRVSINGSYVIGPTEDYWSYTFNEYMNGNILPNGYTITGLGTDSVFCGKLVTLSDEVGIYSYTNDQSITSGKYIKWSDTYGPDSNGNPVEKQFHIYRKIDNGDGTYSYLDELSLGYYEVVVDRVSIDLKYDEFEVEYYVSLTDGTNEENVTYTESTLENGRHVINIVYAVDGKTYKLYVKATNANSSTPNFGISYFTDKGLTVSSGELVFKEIDKYFIGVTINARHFNAYHANVELETIKSDIKFASSLDKYYDRHEHDLIKDNLILKMGEDQNITVKYYNQSDKNHLNEIDAPTNAGLYTIYITANDTEYFNGIEGKYIDFQIKKRIIKLDLSGANNVYQESNSGSKSYDGTSQKFTPISSDLIDRGYLLGDEYDSDGLLVLQADQFVGTLETAGSTPGVYDKDGVYWSTSWGVFTANGENNSSNYQIQIENQFEIVPLKFTITEHPVDVEFDYNLHQATLDVLPADSNYKIYYSTVPFEAGITDYSGYSTLNYDFATPGEYTVYYAVVADNYETVTGSMQVIIRAKTITYHDPAKDVIDATDTDMHYIVQATGAYQPFIVDVTDPIFATVYYSLDNKTWTTTPYELVDVGYLDIYYKIEALYYDTVYSMKNNSVAPIRFMVTEDGLPELDSTYNAEGYSVVYDGNEHYPKLTLPTGFTGKVLYSTDYVNWSETPIGYTDAGSYDVFVRIKLNGYKTKNIKTTIKIEKLSFDGLTLEKYDDYFDGQYHTVGINGLTKEVVKIEDPNNSGQYIDKTIYKYNGIEVNVGFTSNPNVVNAGYGYLSELGYKDVGLYTIYVMVSAPNYNDLYIGASTVNIKFATADLINIDYNYVEIEYTKAPFDTKQLNIQTIHDGIRTYTYWVAENNGGTLSCDFTQQVYDPQELGYYCFMVDFKQSKNCAATRLGDAPYYVYFRIIPRTLEVKWTEEEFYDGQGHSPNAYVESGTSDEITLITHCTNSSDEYPVEIGEYEFDVWMSTVNDNYVLDRSSITMQIKKRQITIDFKDSKEYDGEVYEKNSGWDEVLNLGLLQKHQFIATMTTNRPIKGNYYYTTTSTDVYANTVLVDWDIILLDSNYEPVLDENGDYVSVKDMYDYTLTVSISITDPKLDLSFIEDTVVYYDGEMHSVNIFKQLPAALDGAILSYRLVGEETFHTNPITYVNAGTYEVEVRVQKNGYEPTIITTNLIIKKADLEFDIFDLDEPDNADDDGYDIYDAQGKQTNYSVLNVSSSVIDNLVNKPTSSQGHVRYYSVNDITYEELDEFYSNFNKYNPIFLDSLESITDAGDYYCVVYYYDTVYKWNESYGIKKVTIKPRDINITFSIPYNSEKVYDGEKFTLLLNGATADKTALINGHDFLNDLKYHFVRTNSANAGVYNPAIGFEFVEKTIFDSTGKDVSMNYHPVLSDNVHIEIKRAYLTDDDFIVEDNIKEYDGLVASPKITTPSDGKIKYIFKYYDENNNLVSCTPSNFQSDVGRYWVGCYIEQGTNYYASTDVNPKTGLSLGTKYANCTVVPVETDIIWENTDVEFNGTEQTAEASFTDVFGNQISLEVFYYDEDDNIIYGHVAAGIYEANSRLDSKLPNYESFVKNYILVNTTSLFKITPILYDIVLGTVENGYSVTSKYTGSAWTMQLDNTLIEGFPEGLTLKGLSGDKAILETKSSQPGSYSGNDMFNFNNIRIYKNLEDVTASIGFNVIGTVTIISDQITFVTTNKVFVYTPDKKLFSQTGCLTITNPLASNCSISYVVNGEEKTLIEPEFRDVGYYEIEFTITDKTGKYTDASGVVFIEIVAAESFIEFEDDITKVYDGTPVDVTISENSGFNGTTNDLIFEFAEIITDEYGNKTEASLGNVAPRDVGEYIVYVTCNESYLNENGYNNYTTLNVSKKFSITPREYKLTVNISQTITSSDEGKVWDSGVIVVDSQNELISGNVLKYDIQSNFNIVRTTYTAKKTFRFSDANCSTGLGSAQTQVVDFEATGANKSTYEFTMAWIVLDSNRTMGENNDPLNISKNYYLTFDFTVYIHYQLMEGIEINGGTYAYNGDSYSGTIDFSKANVAQSSVIQAYALDKSHFDTNYDVYGSINNENICYTTPGEYPVYYKLTCPDYEPLTGFFVIKIEKVSRENFTITSSNKKVYDATAMFSKWLSGNNNYLPEYSYDLFKLNGVTLTDNFDPADITIVYQLKGSSKLINSTVGCINAGNYQYTITIPESNNYLKTVYEGEFTIAKREVLVVDSTDNNEIVYTGNTITYNDFGSTSKYDLFYKDDLGNKVALPNSYSLSGIIYTASPNVGLYKGIDNTLSWFNGATVTVDGIDQSINHTVSLKEASLTVTKATITYNDLTTKVPYDGQYHTVNIQMIHPLAYDSILYWDATTNSWTSDPTNFKFRDVGNHPVRIKIQTANYEDEIIDTYVEIERSESIVRIDVDLNKTYDSQEVLIPENVYTSNNEAQDLTMYTFNYYEWLYNPNKTQYEWSIMSTIQWNDTTHGWEVIAGAAISRPVNVGKYLVEVIVPETTNYKSGSATHEFEIKPLSVDVSWEKLEFEYDGTSKTPSAYLPLCGTDSVPLNITVTPQTITADANHKNVGGYLATASIDTSSYQTGNYVINVTTSQTLFNIVKRNVIVSLDVFTPYVSSGTFNYYAATTENPDGFTTAGLVNNTPYIHKINGNLIIKNGSVGTYTEMNSSNGFMWSNSLGETTQCVIRDESNNDVTANYNVKYNLKAVISYSDINANIEPYVGVYDGLYHGITVTINNVNASDYKVEYSIDGVTFTETNPQFKDVVANNGFYTVFYKISRIADPSDYISGRSSVTITPRDAQLAFVNPFINLNKVYDGKKVENPEVVCNDSGATIVYRYYKDSVNDKNLTLNDVVNVGTYVLVVSIQNASTNYTYNELERTFTISKRSVTVSIPTSSKVYDTECWKKDITAANVYNIVSGHTFTGTIQTASVNVGTYSNDNHFDWYNGYVIKDENGTNVTTNYEVNYDLSVEITKAPITVEITPCITTYDGTLHTLDEIKLLDTVVGGKTYPAPTNYTIYYSENPSTDGYSTTPIYKSMVGKWIVYLKIEAENYETLIIKNGEENNSYILIKGLSFEGSEDPSIPVDPDPDNPDGPNANDSNLYFEKNYEYTGQNYPTPEYLNCPSKGEQVVVYYELQDYLDNEADLSNATPLQNVKDAGSYVFVLTIKTDGIYEEKTLVQSFVIKPKTVTLIWEDLELEYTGSDLSPKAYYTQVVPDGGSNIYVTITNVPKVVAGSYDVTAICDDSNYKFDNSAKTFVIKPKSITQPEFTGLETTYGQELIIRDNSGNIYQINENGEVIAVVDDNGDPVEGFELPLPFIFVLGDDQADNDGSTHTLTVKFADKDINNGKSNYEWAVNKSSDDLTFDYVINPITFPNDLTQLIYIYEDVHVYTGEEIEPIPELTVIYSSDNTIFEKLVLGQDYKVEYSNNINVGNAALIKFTGINNYSFSIESSFTIIAKEPDLLTIKEDENVKIQFIIAVYDRENNTGATIVEDELVPERNAENIGIYSYYLSHIYQNTSVEILLKMFMNDSNKMKVYKNKQDYLAGTYIDSLDYSSTYVGTGFVIALYEDDACTKESDTIECIVFGDLNGDGMINLSDKNEITRVLKGIVQIKTSANESDTSVMFINDVYYFAGITNRSNTSVSLSAANDIARMMKGVSGADINIAYKFDSNAFVVPTSNAGN